MKLIRSVGIAAICAALLLPTLTQAQPRVVNGQNASTATYPWMVSVEVASADGVGAFGCGGSLIAPTWVLTAAHCFLNAAGDAVDLSLVNGTSAYLNSDNNYELSSDAVIRRASQLVIHPDYDPVTNDNDIALVELNESVDGLSPVTLHATGQPSMSGGLLSTVMGWGLTSDGGESSPLLLEATQQIVTNSECDTAYGGGITGNMICANGLTPDDTSDTCQGDSGGPMVVAHEGGYVQVGISSFGSSCGDPTTPGVYARVSALEGFITQYVSDARFSSAASVPDNGNDPDPVTDPVTDPATDATACAAPVLGGDLSLSISCIQYGSDQYEATLNIAGTEYLEWVLGSVGPSSCAPSEAVCAVLDQNLALSIRGLELSGATLSAELEFDGAAGTWYYVSHTAQ